jgi:mRNA interferase MazF
MQKDFENWCKRKQITHEENANRFYRRCEVWWCLFGANVGFEMDGKGEKFLRPVLIIKGFSREVCLCVPLTRKIKENIFLHKVTLPDGIQRKAVLSQIRVIDTKRLVERIGSITESELLHIKQVLTQIIA